MTFPAAAQSTNHFLCGARRERQNGFLFLGRTASAYCVEWLGGMQAVVSAAARPAQRDER